MTEPQPRQAGALVGCAGWSIPKGAAAALPEQGSHLERYAAVFRAVEINTSFYRPHQPKTYARWAASVPDGFRFSVKLPKAVTHEARLRDAGELLARFAQEAGALGDKLGCVLVQLPPSLAFEIEAAVPFFDRLRATFGCTLACEARHPGWFGEDATEVLRERGIARVRADPPAGQPGAHVPTTATAYVRLHGSPVVYRSDYPAAYLDELARELAGILAAGHAAWCVFDNTLSRTYMEQALYLHAALERQSTPAHRVERARADAGILRPMVTASFRFYEELNDFLPRDRRGRTFATKCARAATTKHMIEALGVPHTEVELVLVNGESSDFDRLLEEGDRVSVYPKFERFDISPLLRVRERPLRRLRFVADAHLGGLARLLRMAGFDTLYDNNIQDDEIEQIASSEDRVVLTRDRELLKRRTITHGAYVHSLKAAHQLRELVDRLDLATSMEPFTICLHCNAPLRDVDKAEVLDQLPPAVRELHHEFNTCDVCRRVFWKGSHWKRMTAVLAAATGD